MNIIFVVGSLSGGGAERQCLLNAHALAAEGYQVKVCVLSDELSHLKKAKNFSSSLMVIPLCDLRKGSRIGKIFKLVRAFCLLRKIIRASGQDVTVYAWLELVHTIAFSSVLFTPAKLVWAIRNSNMDVHQYYWKMTALTNINRWFSGRVDGVIANSQFGLDYYKNILHYKMKRQVVVSNILDFSKYVAVDGVERNNLRNKYHLNGNYLMVTVSRIDPIKNLENMIRALVQLKKNKPSFSFQYAMIGSGKEEYVDCLKKLVKDLALEAHVVFVGETEWVSEYYQMADLFVLPSWSEGLSNSLLEAISSQLLCVSTDVGDSKVFLPSAAIIEGFTAACIFEKINWALSLSEEEKAAITRTAYQLVRDRCEVEKCTKKTIEFFSTL